MGSSRVPTEQTPLIEPIENASASTTSIVEESRLSRASKKLWTATLLCFVFMTIEIVGGYLAGSLAVMTDAAHLLTDIAGFLISIFSLSLSRMAPTKALSFGFGRAEILGALTSVVIIWILTGVLLYEAILRAKTILANKEHQPVQGNIMFFVALIGLCFNLVLLRLFSTPEHPHGHSHGLPGHQPIVSEKVVDEEAGGDHGHDHSHSHDHSHGVKNPKKLSLNISAAYAHALGDLVQSLGVCIAGGIIWRFPYPEYPRAQLSDPLATFLFSILVLRSTTSIIFDSVRILMQCSPEHVDIEELMQGLRSINAVVGVHHLHVWSISSHDANLSVHVQVQDEADMKPVLSAVQDYLRVKGLTHNTVQMEVINVHDRMCVPDEPNAPVCYEY